MIVRVDRLQIELEMPEQPDPAAAAIVQELLGGRFGEMSTWMNYTFQSFNFRGRGVGLLGHFQLDLETVDSHDHGRSFLFGG